MSWPEMEYLIVPASATEAAKSLEEETAKLRTKGFEFTGKIEEIKTVLFFKLEFIKPLKEDEDVKTV